MKSCCGNHDSPPADELASKLRRNLHKVTGARQAVLEVLRRERRPMTNKEIHQQLDPGVCDLATIYRCMHLLEKMGLVQRFDFGDGIKRYELVHSEGGRVDHHHHLICTRCTRIVEVEDCYLQELQDRIAARNGFRSVTHRLEFFGICGMCSEKKELP